MSGKPGLFTVSTAVLATSLLLDAAFAFANPELDTPVVSDIDNNGFRMDINAETSAVGTVFAICDWERSQPVPQQIRQGRNGLGTPSRWAGESAIGTDGLAAFDVAGLRADQRYLCWTYSENGSAGQSDPVVVSVRTLPDCYQCSGRRGSLLWEDQADGTSRSGDTARAVKVAGGKVFVVGDMTNIGTESDFHVRVYKARTGKLLWEDSVTGTEYSFDSDERHDVAYDVDVWNGRLYVAGVLRNAVSGFDFYVRAYNANDGTVLWEDTVDIANGFDRAFAVSASRNGVSVAGSLDYSASANELTMAIRTYHPKTGALLWQDTIPLSGASGIAFDVDTSNPHGIGAMVGTNRGADGSGAFTVRTYKATN